MDAQLVVVPGCPNEGPAAAVLRRALDDVGLAAVRFTTIAVDDQAEAERLGCTGMPAVPRGHRDLRCAALVGLRRALERATDQHPAR